MHSPSFDQPERDFSGSIPELRRWEAARAALPNVSRRSGIADIDPENHTILMQSFRYVAERFGTTVQELPVWDELPRPPSLRPLHRFSPLVVEAACSRDRSLWSFLVAGGSDKQFVVDVRATRYLPSTPRSSIVDPTALPLVRTAVAIGMGRHEAFRSAAYMFIPYSRADGSLIGSEVMLFSAAFREAEDHLREVAAEVTRALGLGQRLSHLGVRRAPASILLWHSLQFIACEIGPASQIVGIRHIEPLPKQRLKLELAVYDPALGGIVLADESTIARPQFHAVREESVLTTSRVVHFGIRTPGSFAFVERVA